MDLKSGIGPGVPISPPSKLILFWLLWSGVVFYLLALLIERLLSDPLLRALILVGLALMFLVCFASVVLIVHQASSRPGGEL